MSMTVRKTTVSSLNPSFHFPEEIIIEILSRLPVKSLIRFTVVCKSWNALIENPNFISKHFKQNPNPDFNYLLVVTISLPENNPRRNYAMSLHSEHDFDNPINLDFPFLGEKDYFSVVGVFNGLVCISLSMFEFDLVICNPSTRRFSKIPNFGSLEADCLHNGEAAYGFTFDPCCDDYKLINITRYFDSDDEHREKAGVYTMSTDSWREIDIDVPIDKDLRIGEYSASALIDNVFYWECYEKSSSNAVFLCFNMIDESFSVISAPQGFNGLWDVAYWKSFQLKEEFAIFAFTSERCFVVWTLNADSVGWNLKYVIPTIPEIATPGEIEEIGGITLVGLGKDGDVIYQDRTCCDVKLFSYDLDSGEIKRLPFGELGYDYEVIGYKESLIPVKKNNQV